MALTQQQINEITTGTGQFAGYRGISGSEYDTPEKRAAWQAANPLGVQQVGNSLYGYVPPDSGGNVDIASGANDMIADSSNIAQQVANELANSASMYERMESNLYAQYQAEAQQGIEKAQGEKEKSMGLLEEATNRDIYAEYEAEMEKLGMKQKIEDVNKVRTQMMDLEQQYITERNQLRRESKLANLYKGKSGLMYENYMEQATMLNNRMSFLNEDRQMMQNQLDKFYDASMTQMNNQINTYSRLMELADSNIISLKKDEKEYVLSSVKLLKDREEKQEAEKKDRINLFMQAAENGIDYTQLGIKPTDDLETIMSKLAPAFKAQYDAGIARSISGSGGGLGDEIFETKLDLISNEAAISLVNTYKYIPVPEEVWDARVSKIATDTGTSIPEVEESLGRMMNKIQTEKGLPTGLKSYDTSGGNVMGSDISGEDADKQISVTGLSSYTPQSTFLQKAGDTIKENIISNKNINKTVQKNIDKLNEEIDSLQADIDLLSSVQSPTSADKRALSNAKNKLNRKKRELQDYMNRVNR